MKDEEKMLQNNYDIQKCSETQKINNKLQRFSPKCSEKYPKESLRVLIRPRDESCKSGKQHQTKSTNRNVENNADSSFELFNLMDKTKKMYQKTDQLHLIGKNHESNTVVSSFLDTVHKQKPELPLLKEAKGSRSKLRRQTNNQLNANSFDIKRFRKLRHDKCDSKKSKPSSSTTVVPKKLTKYDSIEGEYSQPQLSKKE